MSALQGIQVIELAEGVAGEYCGKLLSDFGAEIIKVERPDTGSPTRTMAPARFRRPVY
jgi:crotonobetainyl-CoA:carnitine CoA-transferase CaiB-like acyl-CoA transferase